MIGTAELRNRWKAHQDWPNTKRKTELPAMSAGAVMDSNTYHHHYQQPANLLTKLSGADRLVATSRYCKNENVNLYPATQTK